MTRNLIFLSILLLFVFFLNACQKELEIDLPFEGKKLVLYSILNVEDDIEAVLSQTFPPTGKEPNDILVSNAQIAVFEDGIFFDSLVFDWDEGIYLSTHGKKPHYGHNYYFSAQANTFPDIRSAEVSLPNSVPISSTTFEDSSFDTGSTNLAGGIVEINFQDPLNSKEYYFLNAKSIFENKVNPFSSCLGGDLKGVCVEFEDFLCLFEDNCLALSPARLRVGIKTSEQTLLELNKVKSIVVELQSLNFPLYQYYRTNDQPIGIDLAFSEPYSIHSNIEGGYGLVGAISISLDTIIVE